jgi:hypothetical protein
MIPRTLGVLLVMACGVGATACGASEPKKSTSTSFAPKTNKIKATRNPDGSLNDQSRCDTRKPNRESSETAGPGYVLPNVRRVWQVVGTGDDRQKVRVCREIDTNYDGIKDVVRTYNDKGESLHEEADSNYDGRIDTWITFSKGRLAEMKVDTNHDGKLDEWKAYSGGQLSRIKRDSNGDGKPDVWEIYRQGRLERMGVDLNGDEQVDRWDHDNEQRRRFEEAERKKEEEEAAKAAKKAADEKAAADKLNEADGGDAAAPSKDKPAAPKKK